MIAAHLDRKVFSVSAHLVGQLASVPGMWSCSGEGDAQHLGPGQGVRLDTADPIFVADENSHRPRDVIHLRFAAPMGCFGLCRLTIARRSQVSGIAVAPNALDIALEASSSMAPGRSLITLLLPGGVLVLAGLILFRPGVLPGAMQPYLYAYPYLVFGVGAILGWYFNRSRVVFGLLILTVAAMMVPRPSAEGVALDDVGRLVFDAVAVLLPLNLPLTRVQLTQPDPR